MKIKLPKRFYTPEQLAERWECKVEDVTHLIETNLLEHAHKGAVSSGHKYIRVVAFRTEEECVRCIKEQNHPNVLYFPVQNPRYPYVSNEEVEKEEMDRMRKRGEFDQVILAAEVSRFEREHGDTKTPTAITDRTETTYLTVIGGLVSLILGKSQDDEPNSVFENQTAVIDALLSDYGHVKGMGDSNLKRILALANKTLKDSLIPGG